MEDTIRPTGSKLLCVLRGHPWAALAVTFLLVCGIACGISTASALGESGLLSGRGTEGGWQVWAWLRLIALNLAVFSLLALGEYFVPVLLLAAPLIAAKGVTLGLAAWELALAFPGRGALYGIGLVLLPACVTVVSLLMVFVQAVQKRPRLLAVVKLGTTEGRKLFWRNLVLLLLGTLLETGAALLLWQLTAV